MNESELRKRLLSLNPNEIKVTYYLCRNPESTNKTIGDLTSNSPGNVGTLLTSIYTKLLEEQPVNPQEKRKSVAAQYKSVVDDLKLNPEDFNKLNWDDIWNNIRKDTTPLSQPLKTKPLKVEPLKPVESLKEEVTPPPLIPPKEPFQFLPRTPFSFEIPPEPPGLDNWSICPTEKPEPKPVIPTTKEIPLGLVIVVLVVIVICLTLYYSK